MLSHYFVYLRTISNKFSFLKKTLPSNQKSVKYQRKFNSFLYECRLPLHAKAYGTFFYTCFQHVYLKLRNAYHVRAC